MLCMVRINVSMEKYIVDTVDKFRGDVPRSKYFRNAVIAYNRSQSRKHVVAQYIESHPKQVQHIVRYGAV